MDEQKKNRGRLAQLKRRYAQLTRRLSKLGPVLQGTITERAIERPDPHNPKRTRTYGPYYQWTFKRAGKTVTVNLTRQQAKRYQTAINNQRTFEQIADQMRELSLQILDATTKSVPKRKPRTGA